jgi:HD-GYP domain-containing protein (c-di-GMP phosphodiesterase class II)
MENHVVMTEKILDKVHFNKNYAMVPKWAAKHHEFLNGTGYPNQLMGEDLDLESRILTISDIFDALTARDRPYKKPMPKQNAIQVLKNMAEEGKLDIQLVAWLEESM